MERLIVLTAALTPKELIPKTVTESSPVSDVTIPVFPPGLYPVDDFKYEENPHPLASLSVPGLTIESFDIHWNPRISSIMKASDLARDCALSIPFPHPETERQEQKFFMDWPHFSHNFSNFILATEFDLTRSIYDAALVKGPLDMKFTLGSVDNSSMTFVSNFFAPCVGKGVSTPLWTNTVQLAALDKTTRRPAKLPDWYQSKYKGRGCRDVGLVIEQFQRPAVTYAHPFVVQWSECGTFGTADWTAYASWAIDALHAALLLQTDTKYSPYSTGAPQRESQKAKARTALGNITQDIIARGVCKMQAVFLGECLLGDYIETHLWQDSSGERELVHFSVVKDSKDVCQMKMWFFGDSL